MWDIIIAFILTFLVRVCSVMGGGGRLALIPMLTVLLGLDTPAAIATMKVSNFSSLVAIIKFHQKKLINWFFWKRITPFVVLGAMGGTFLVIIIDQELLQTLVSISICISLCISLLFLAVKNKLSEPTRSIDERVSFKACAMGTLAGLLGALFGFKGMFLRYYYVSRGMNFLQATATNQATSLVANVLSIVGFSAAGIVNWPIAITMFVAGGLGSWVGSNLGIKLGSIWLERIFIGIIIIGAILMFLKVG